MIEIRKADDRGHADFGWLQSYHTFSFGHYMDEKQMCHSALRVINDDTVAPGAGFDTHGHRDMEIISLVTSGEIEHKDSMGNVQKLPAGEYQLMSAGKGVFHSEYNASQEDALKFLQIWIVPDENGGQPGYQQKPFGETPGLTPIISPDGNNGTLKIKQQAWVSQLILLPGESQELRFNAQRHAYIHVVRGAFTFNDDTVVQGDGIKVSNTESLTLRQQSEDNAMAIVFDLP